MIWMSPEHINADSFLYISIANYYLFSPSVVIRDTFTVGPLIPVLLALTKGITLKFMRWTPDVDIYLLKGIAFLCHVIITTSAYKVICYYIDTSKTFITLFLLLAFLTMGTDTLSLNGELVSVTIISLIMALFRSQRRDVILILMVSVLVVLAIYTKLQAIPILTLLILSESRDRRELRSIFVYVFCIFAAVEAFLYLNEVGVTRNLSHIYRYLSQGALATSIPDGGSSSIYIALRRNLSHFGWVVTELITYFPISLFIVFALLFGNQRNRANFFSDWRVWICITIFSIGLPGRQFPHYLLLILPFILKFSGPAVSIIQYNPLMRREKYFLYSSLLVLLLGRVITSMPDVNQLRATWAGVFPGFSHKVEIDDVRNILGRDPGTIFVHGWDYNIYSRLNAYAPKVDLVNLKLGAIDERTFIDSVISNEFDYLVDVIDYSGLIRDHKYSLSNQNPLGVGIARYYDVVYQRGGLRLYRRIAKQVSDKSGDDSRAIYSASDTTNKEWVNGVARGWAAAFFVSNTLEAAEDFAVKKKVLLSDGSIRTVTSSQEGGGNLIVFLDGSPLDGRLVGYPKPIKPYIQSNK